MNQQLNPRFATQSDADLRMMLGMAEDAIADGSTDPGPVRVRDEIQAVLAFRTGKTAGVETEARVDDGVRVGREAGSPTSNQYGTFTVYAATDKQVAFAQRLLNEKDTTGVKIPTTLEGISKTACSALIDRLIDRPAKASAATPAKRLASEKQVNLIKKLFGEKDLTGTAFTVWNDELLAQLGSQEASKAIDMLFALPRKPQPVKVELAAGAYRVGDSIIRVYLGQQSRKMLAAELVDITAEDRDDAWKYLGLASRFVTADAHRMTVEECEALAGESGQSFSWCCVCGRRLDDPNSVSRGIGPVCRAKQGL